MVEIYLNMQESQAPFPFLSIPLSDVLRLSIRPFKWLRYVMFSICGARGDLSAMPEGPAVDYQSTALVDDVTYYYKPSENCTFVDYEGRNDPLTSSSQSESESHANFRRDILVRDGSFCVVTQYDAIFCDATHLIPRSKGDEYIEKVVRVRSPLYDGTAPVICRIDAVENGVLLSRTVHAMLSECDIAFLKTPGYGLDPTDIHRVDPGPTQTVHFTLQHLKESVHYDPTYAAAMTDTTTNLDPAVAFTLGLNVDVLFQGTGSSLPPAVILDYVYGVAAYKQWKSRHFVCDIMQNYHQEQLSPWMGHKIAKAMDDMNLDLMLVQGITPQEAANRREKQKEEKLKIQEVSQSKVTEWMEAMVIGDS